MIKPKKLKLKFNEQLYLTSSKKTRKPSKKNKLRLKKIVRLKLKRIRFLFEIKTYRGIRLKKGLPARGQRTRTNATSCLKKVTAYENQKKKSFVTQRKNN